MLKSEPKDEQDGANVRNKGGKDPTHLGNNQCQKLLSFLKPSWLKIYIDTS